MKTFLFSAMFFMSGISFSQEFRTDVSYKYMFANKWDKAIQTYNFSRPYIKEKQPLLKHGLNASASFIFKSSKTIKHGINLSYSYFRSSATNENLSNILNLHFLSLGYLIHYENSERTKNFYTDLIISAVSSGLYRKVNGETYTVDEKALKALGIGGDLSIRAGYYINLKNKICLSPFILIGSTPYIYSPNSEVVFNQTKGLIVNNSNLIFLTQVGLTFHFRKLKND